MTRFEQQQKAANTLVLDIARHCISSSKQRASLRRNQGDPLDDARDVEWFRHFMARWHEQPDIQGTPSDGIIFLVATLFADDRATLDYIAKNEKLPEVKSNLGGSLDDVEKIRDQQAWDAKRMLKPDPQRRESRFERRLRMLLDADLSSDGRGELAFRLRQCVRLVLAERDTRTRIDWGRLLYDLLRWNYDTRSARREWAQSFYNDPRVATSPIAIQPNLDTDIEV
jgi:CRISPR-associated protein Cse2 (CRISPR_cse2)